MEKTEFQIAELLHTQGHLDNLRLADEFADVRRRIGPSDLFDTAIAIALTWSGHAKPSDDFLRCALDYLASADDEQLASCKQFSQQLGPKHLVDALWSWFHLKATADAVDWLHCDAATLCQAQQQIIKSELLYNFPGVGPWLLRAPFKVVALFRRDLWDDAELDGLQMPSGAPVLGGIQKLLGEGYSFGSATNAADIREATGAAAHEFTVNAAAPVAGRVLHLNSGLHALGEGTIDIEETEVKALLGAHRDYELQQFGQQAGRLLHLSFSLSQLSREAEHSEESSAPVLDQEEQFRAWIQASPPSSSRGHAPHRADFARLMAFAYRDAALSVLRIPGLPAGTPSSQGQTTSGNDPAILLSDLQRDMNWLRIVVTSSQGMWEEMARQISASEPDAAARAVALTAEVAECAERIKDSSDFFARYLQEFPAATLGLEEIRAIADYHAQILRERDINYHPPSSPREIAQELGCSDDTVRLIIKQMVKLKILAEQPKTKPVKQRRYTRAEVNKIKAYNEKRPGRQRK